MRAYRIPLTGLAISMALMLAACSSGQDQAAPQQPAATGTAAAAPAASANALTADQVNVQMTLQGTPTLSADGQSIDVTVTLANHGTVVLNSTGPNPVTLGAHSADANGTIVDNDLARASLPDIATGGQATVTIQLPMDKTLGKSAQILPVQENVAWFDTWGTKPLVVGPFNNCASAATGKVCGADGKPLASATH
jgi:glucose/arabinose dehydrogenase